MNAKHGISRQYIDKHNPVYFRKCLGKQNKIKNYQVHLHDRKSLPKNQYVRTTFYDSYI